MTEWDFTERTATVALLWRAPSATARRRLTQRAVEAESALAVLREEVGQPTLLDDPVEGALAAAGDLIASWEADGLSLTTFLERSYPARLRGVHDMPGLLFTEGTVIPDDRGIAVVGSRAASESGQRRAYRIAQELVGRGITVVSGLAAGIDGAAHRGALDAGGRTVGVIGTGIRQVYPPQHHQLHRQVASSGLLLSQFWPDTAPDKHTFPARNATMSGYALATVVVEAGEQSGARIQARQAVEHGRPVVLLRSVVESTHWGAEFAQRPDVHVAQSEESVLAHVDELMARPGQLEALLGRLAAGR
ncbi:DNA-processing protein DprA [Streptomyces alboflavus]|uniref:DNA-processing protein DprA n=1 Tax=Streptomyces alboflavus TaxID=67267 RepID=UPI000524C779|nr:DNA-processing protein DprA [Streptomyces alboflavus]